MKLERITTSLLIAMLIFLSFSNLPRVYSQAEIGEYFVILFSNVRSARARFVNSEGDEGTFGFQILGEEDVDGERAWKIRWELIEKGYEPVYVIVWVSKSTGKVLQIEHDGEVSKGEMAELAVMPLLVFWNVWFISTAEKYSPERIAEYTVTTFGRYSFIAEPVLIGSTQLFIYKLSWEGFPTAPEVYRVRWYVWWAPTNFGVLLVKHGFETLDRSEWYTVELLSVELAEPQPVPRILVKTEIGKTHLRPGEETVVKITFSNQGSAIGMENITLTVNGEVVKSWFITSKPGESGTLTHSLSFTKEGNYTVQVGDEMFLVTVSAVRPAKFEVSELAVTPSSIKLGETVSISVKIANTGGEASSYDVVLKINGQPVSTKTVSLEPGASTTVTFSYTPETEGTYEIDVSGLGGSLTVTKPEEAAVGGAPWLLIATVAAVVVIAIVIGALLLLKRRSQKPLPPPP